MSDHEERAREMLGREIVVVTYAQTPSVRFGPGGKWECTRFMRDQRDADDWSRSFRRALVAPIAAALRTAEESAARRCAEIAEYRRPGCCGRAIRKYIEAEVGLGEEG